MTGEAQRAAFGIEPGDRVGPYLVTARIGGGAGGAVFVGRQDGLHRLVAIKVVSPVVAAAEEKALQRFLDEARLLAMLDHPGIVRVLDTGVHAGLPWFSMDLVRGASLAAVIAAIRAVGGRATGAIVRATVRAGAAAMASAATEPDAGWSLSENHRMAMVAIAADVADALAAAHAAGVVHRDVKPGNVLLRQDGAALLADFGIARRDRGIAATGDQAIGTPGYAAPEQSSGGEVDARSDGFALGVTLFEALTGRMPFPGRTSAEVAMRHAAGPAPDLRRCLPRCPRDLAAVVAKALAIEPAHRYASAADFAADLRAVLAGEPVRARPEPWLSRGWRIVKRRPWRSAAAVLVLSVLGTGLVLDRRNRAVLRLEGERTAAALDELSRLRLGGRLARAEARLATWQPLRVSEHPAIESWLEDEAVPLYAELADVVAKRDELRAAALPYGTEEAMADHRRLGLADAAQQVADEVAFREQELAAGSGDAEEHRAHLASLWESSQKIVEAVAARRSWRLHGADRQFLHDQLADLAARRERFGGGPGSAVGRLRATIAWVQDSHRRCVTTAAARWQVAAADVAADPRFGGLALSARSDLLPLRADARSGLWEFVHVRSGDGAAAEPTVGADGRLELSAGTGIVFVLLPGGTFAIGAQSGDAGGRNHDPDAKPYEGPVADIALEPFYCAKYELTQGQWLRLVGGANPSARAFGKRMPRLAATPLHPLENVSLVVARRELAAFGLRLPTEAQWEYAARAGTTTPWSFGAATAAAAHANVADASAKRAGAPWTCDLAVDDGFVDPAAVGSFAPNAFGLHDVHGNVAELVDDHSVTYLRPRRGGDGRAPPAWQWEVRSHRGGTHAHNLAFARSASRSLGESPEFRAANLGVRVVLSLQP